MALGLLGFKVGMTQVFAVDGSAEPVTVIQRSIVGSYEVSTIGASDTAPDSGRVLVAWLKDNGRAYTARSWGDAVKSWTRGVERWTTEQLDQAIAQLLATDAALKESRLSSEEQAMATLLLSICGLASRASRPAA